MSLDKHPAGHMLQAFHDKELDPAAAAEVRAHCDVCDECRRELGELSRVSRMLDGATAPELPHSVWDRVRPGRPRESRLQPVFGFAACAAGIVVGILLGPIEFRPQTADSALAWSETVTVWDGDASASLLNVFQYEQQ